MATINVRHLGLGRNVAGPKEGTVEGTTSGVRIRTRGKRRITLVVGGERSGKSSYVQDYAVESADEGRYFIATAEPLDEEMKARITAHQASRDGKFTTIEEPVRLSDAVRALPVDAQVCVIDCMTVWMGNLLYHKAEEGALEDFLSALHDAHCHILIVTNEVGMGVIPETSESRRYVDLLGRANQKVAALADDVIAMVCGIPFPVKGKLL
jgi:adenosylcobinamide kinase/adenosylcobinamide-phosphate guanylyltransferase